MKVTKDNTGSIRLFKPTHKKLKIFIAKNGGNITTFASEAVEEKIKSHLAKTPKTNP